MITLLNKFDDQYMMQAKDVLDVVSVYSKENNLEEYIKDVIFSTNSKYLGFYNLKNGEIVLNSDKITNFCYQLFSKLQKKRQIEEKYYSYYFNFYYLYIIFHELTHVQQKARYDNSKKEKDIFSVLYELSKQIRFDDATFYIKFHDIFPMEIEANNQGFFKAYKLMSYTKLPNRECKIMYLQYLLSLLLNYQKVGNEEIMAPFERLLIKTNNTNVYEKYNILNNNKLSKVERLNYGLNITLKEYASIENAKRKILMK